MAQPPIQSSPPEPTPPYAAGVDAVPSQSDQTPPPPFDPSRMIGIIKRKDLIKKLAAVYHAECLSYCQQLLEFQANSQEPFIDYVKTPPDEPKKDLSRPSKRSKKTR